MAKVDFILDMKGGIGKSFIASSLAQFVREQQFPDKKEGLICYDIDPNCRTFFRQKNCSSILLDIMTDGEIEKQKFDALFTNICNAKKMTALSSILAVTLTIRF